MNRLIPWLAPTLLLCTGLGYFLNPQFSLAFNQICEMLSTGNARGLLMFFHGAGPLGPMLSLGIGVAAFLIPVLKPVYLLQANVEFFGHSGGVLLMVLSAGISLGILALLGCTLLRILPGALQTRLKAIPHARILLLLAASGWLLLRL